MSTEPVRASADWLRLREPADARARAARLVDEVRTGLTGDRVTVVHDLGCGSGSMARWLAARLPGPQHWVLYDRDAELLALAAAQPPAAEQGGPRLSVQTRLRDVTRLDPAELAGATLVTASALLDMLTRGELERLVATATSAGCPVLIALSVTGEVELTPQDPLDRRVAAAFNAHQRRPTGGGRLLGPDAPDVAVGAFRRHGLDVLVRPSPWLLGPAEKDLASAWFLGWVAAACEQQPELAHQMSAYVPTRMAQAAEGRLRVVVGHQDLLARPR